MPILISTRRWWSSVAVAGWVNRINAGMACEQKDIVYAMGLGGGGGQEEEEEEAMCLCITGFMRLYTSSFNVRQP